MTSNYPPDVTGNEPQIAGESHYKTCPMADDWECSDDDYKRIDPYEVRDLVNEAFQVSIYISKRSLGPFRWMLDCRCGSIGQDLKDDAAENATQREVAP